MRCRYDRAPCAATATCLRDVRSRVRRPIAQPHGDGRLDDGTHGEVFISGGKSGEAVEAIARDGAVLLSLALQYGVDLANIRSAITRDGQAEPSTIIGAVVDRLSEES